MTADLTFSWRRLQRTAVATMVLSAGVVALEHFSHGAAGPLHHEVAHVLRDALLGAPLAYLALIAARRIAGGEDAEGSALRRMFVRAATASLLFGLLLIPGVSLHQRIDGVSHAGDGLLHAVVHGLRVVWSGLPLAALAVLIHGPAGSFDPRRGRVKAPPPTPLVLPRVALAAALTAGVGAGVDASAASAAESGSAAVATGCNEVGAVVPTTADRVRPHVPGEFKLSAVAGSEVAGRVDVFVRAYRCNSQTLDGRTVVDTKTVTFGALIEDPDGSPANYTFSYLTDNPYLVAWMKTSTGMERIHHVPKLSMERHGIGPATTYVVVSPAGSPSPFRMSATSAPDAPAGFALTGRWWSELRRDSADRASYLKFTNVIPAYRLAGGMAQLEVAPDSFMAGVFGSPRVSTYSLGGDFERQETTWSTHVAPPGG